MKPKGTRATDRAPDQPGRGFPSPGGAVRPYANPHLQPFLRTARKRHATDSYSSTPLSPVAGAEIERAVKALNDSFELNLATELDLSRGTAALLVQAGTGIDDDLNGSDPTVDFAIRGLNGTRAEIIQSLAK